MTYVTTSQSRAARRERLRGAGGWHGTVELDASSERLLRLTQAALAAVGEPASVSAALAWALVRAGASLGHEQEELA